MVVGLLAVLLLIVVFVPLSIIGQYALRDIVVRRERVLGSVGSGYGLFRRNIGSSLLLWLIQIGLSIGIGIAFILVVLIVGLVLFYPDDRAGRRGLLHGCHHRWRDSGSDPASTPARGRRAP